MVKIQEDRLKSRAEEFQAELYKGTKAKPDVEYLTVFSNFVLHKLAHLELEFEDRESTSQARLDVGNLSLRVSKKGGVSVYGLGRFPVTLYKEQWGGLFEITDEIKAFIKENEHELKSKDAS